MVKKVFRTKLCDELGIEYPVCGAGMGGGSIETIVVSIPELAAAVSNAGGLGFIAGGGVTGDDLREWIRRMRSLTDKPFGVNIVMPGGVPESGNPEDLKSMIPPEHVAFVKKLMKEMGIPKPKEKRESMFVHTRESIRGQVEILLDERVPVISVGLGNPGEIVPEAHRRGMKVIGLVGNVRNARRVAAAGVDYVVAQGTEAGGHNSRVATLALVPQVVDAIYPTGYGRRPGYVLSAVLP